ncbi:MAG: hypothetical protein H0U58_01005 [Chloroflexi bacterium]|nr:hypothetical protein [Chloroflexota bacterium]
MTALIIPALESTTDLIPMDARPAARDHLLAWDASQRLVAIQDAGHASACGALSIPCRAIDITHRNGGLTQLGSPLEDTALPWETSERMLSRIVVALSGSSAERVVLCEHTNGGESDFDAAVTLALKWFKVHPRCYACRTSLRRVARCARLTGRLDAKGAIRTAWPGSR